ncbi:CPSF A subunit region-domain-containing protein [Obelidium mucronatum]|nr:CPSF A subunit region-domain-containing protein [Obelidium mucronatum]
MYPLTTSVHGPTSIEHSVSCSFTGPEVRNVVVCRASLLQVYEVVGSKATLQLISEFKLSGVVSSIASVLLPTTKNGRKGIDALLLAFNDAKMSLVEYSQATASIVTVSIHYFEREEFKKELILEKSPPVIRVDPQSRCAALSFYGDRVAILPFKQDVSSDADDPASKYPFHPSYVFKVTDIDPKVRLVVDFCFLHDFIEPTMAILFETYQSWTGRLAARSDTKSLLVVSLDSSSHTASKASSTSTPATSTSIYSTRKTAFPILYQTAHLPYNSTSIHPLQSPLNGGLLIHSTNALIYVDQTCLPGIAVAFNSFYGREHNLPAPPPADSLGPTPILKDNLLYHSTNVTDYKAWGCSLEGAQLAFINPDTCLVVLGGGGVGHGAATGGECLVVELVGHDDAGRGWLRRNGGVKRFRAVRCGIRGTVPGCMSRIVGGSCSSLSSSASSAKGGGLKDYFDEGEGVSDMLLFLGSRVSDSLLIRVREYPGVGALVVGTVGKVSAAAAVTAMDEDDDDDDDFPRFYLKVCDTLLGLGPIRDMAVGEPAKYSDDAFTPGDTVLRRDLEAVCCVGQEAYGALGVLSQNVRPKILTTVELAEIKETWSVKCFDPNASEADNEFHKFLIMSKEFGTTVLKTGDELQEISDSGFYTAGPTVFATSVLKDTAIMQVQPNGVLLLDYEGKLVQNLAIGDDNTWVVSCSVSDAYVVLLLNIGDLVLLHADEAEERKLSILLEKKDAAITSASLFCRPAGSLNLQTVANVLTRQGKSLNFTNDDEAPLASSPTNNKRKRADSIDQDSKANGDDDDDDDLYGGAGASTSKPIQPVEVEQRNGTEQDTNTVIKEEIYCFAYKDNGSLDVLQLPDLTPVFSVPFFSHLSSTIYDTFDEVSEEDRRKSEPGADINEILVVSLGPDSESQDVYLMARTETGDLIIYKAITHEDVTPRVQPARNLSTSADGQTPTTPANTTTHGGFPPIHRLAVSFVRVYHSHVSRDPVTYSDGDGDKLKPVPKAPVRPSFVKRDYLRPFNQIGSFGGADGKTGSFYCGVFMTGKYPCWIMTGRGGGSSSVTGFEVIDGMDVPKGIDIEEAAGCTGKRFLRVHPCLVDGNIKTFAELHNVNVPFGFVYVNEKGLLRLCQLPWQFNYDLEWPMCKVSLRRAPHKITYHFESETYIMAASTPFPFNLSKAQQAAALAAGVLDQGEELEIVSEKAKEDRTGLYFASTGAYSLELISPITWETVDRFQLDEFEQVLCCQVVSLDSKQTTTGKKLFLAVGTGMCRGEDLTARGRILVFEIIDVVPEIDNPQTCHKFKLLHKAEEKSPITALCGLNGYLVCAIGSRMIIHTFEDDTLNGIAFLDTNIYVNNLTSVKNTIVLSDVVKGMWFCGFQEDPPKLKMLGKDFNPMMAYGCEYIVDDDMMSFIVSDHDKNMHVLQYLPESFQSYEGQKLIHKGEMHLGTRVQKYIRLRKLPPPKPKFGPIQFSKQYFCVGGTLDGGLNFTIPCSEKLYKRLYAVYSRLVNNLQPLAGLNPRGYRQIQTRNKPVISSGPPGPKSILDGDLLFQYLWIPVPLQKDIAKGVGSTVERIIDDLLEVMSGTEYF